MNAEQTKQSIEAFLRDIDVLDELKRWNKQINFFDITGIVNTEIRHSNFLSWLLDANETHGLGDGFVRRFINQVFYENGISSLDIAMIDYDSFEVKREWQHIDLMLVSEKEKVVFVIENKVYSTESKGQLQKYHDVVESHYPNYRKYYLYLTLEGEEPSDPDKWMVATYTTLESKLRDSLEMTNSISDESRLIVTSYIDTIRRKLLMDKELQDLCWKIYKKHKTALKTIFEVTQDSRSLLSSEIKNILEANQEEFGIRYNPSFSTTTIIRFTTPFIDEILPKHESGYGWNNGYRFMYEFQIRKSGLFLIGVTSEQNDPICQTLKEYAIKNSKKYNLRVNTNSSIWTIVFKVSYILKTSEFEDGIEEVSSLLPERIEKAIKKDILHFENGIKELLG